MLGIIQKPAVGKVVLVDIDKIKPNPSQPRKVFDNNALFGLAESIRHNGILQPLTVRARQEGYYELVAGERRLRASQMCGLREVPCIEIKLDESQSAVLSLLENLQREDLSFFEEADGIARLIENHKLTQGEIARRLGKTQSTVANKLRLLRLNETARTRIQEGGLTERHARAVLRLENEKLDAALEHIIEHNLNVAETDRYIEKLLEPQKPKVKPKYLPVIKDVRLFLNTVSNAVQVMKQAGIEAESTQREEEDFIEYIVRIPRCKARQTG